MRVDRDRVRAVQVGDAVADCGREASRRAVGRVDVEPDQPQPVLVREVEPFVWYDPRFRALSITGKQVYWLLLTHPVLAPTDAMQAPHQEMAGILGCDIPTFMQGVREASGYIKARSQDPRNEQEV